MEREVQKARKELDGVLNRFEQHSPEALAHRGELGAINFEAGKDLLVQSVDSAKELRALPTHSLPPDTLKQIREPARVLADTLDAIAGFTLADADPARKRDELLKITSGKDQRVKIISITRKGRARIKVAMPLWQSVQGSLIEKLGPQKWARVETLLPDLSKALP